MSGFQRFELVSLMICPYVQRSVITLMHKKIDFALTHIDLQSPPEWFEKVSPLGKVPVLLVRESAGVEPIALFESAVINEYLDEVTPPMIMPKEPLKKAYERAWVEAAGELLNLLHAPMMSSDAAALGRAKTDIFDIFAHLERALPGGSTFRGGEFSLVDAAFAPFFRRALLFRNFRDEPRWREWPKTRRWAEALLALPEVRDSVVPDFDARFASFVRRFESPWAAELSV